MNDLSHDTKIALSKRFNLPLELFDKMFIDELSASSNGEQNIVLRSNIILDGCTNQDSNEDKESWEE